MSDYYPLFLTNTARSGSNLIGQMLTANSAVNIASEPFLELFRSIRNSFIRVGAPTNLQHNFDPDAPVQDYYFSDERIGLMDVVQNGDLSTVVLDKEWDLFLKKTTPRTALTCAELIPYIEQMKGSSYKEMIDNGLAIIAKARNASRSKWVGIKESWNIEFFATLARSYPDAKFVIILRDPRAMINSHLGVVNSDPSKIASILSYARHWRKYVAFTIHYQNDPEFADRLYLLTHEQVLNDPAGKAQDLCDFLEIKYSPDMTNTNNFIDYATGKMWQGNSSFEEVTAGFSTYRAERWREKLDSRVLRMIEFTCGFDMKLMGYEPTSYIGDKWPDSDVLEYLVQSADADVNWRSDFKDPQLDYGFELFRHSLITQSKGHENTELIRRSFLFEEVFARLHELVINARASN